MFNKTATVRVTISETSPTLCVPMSEVDLSKWKVTELKEHLRKLNLRTDGLKIDLIARIMEASKDVSETRNTPAEPAMTSRESQLLMELEEMKQRLQRQAVNAPPCPAFSPPAFSQNYVSGINIATIAELLSFFDGDGEEFERWEKQVRLLAATYNLAEEMCS